MPGSSRTCDIGNGSTRGTTRLGVNSRVPENGGTSGTSGRGGGTYSGCCGVAWRLRFTPFSGAAAAAITTPNSRRLIREDLIVLLMVDLQAEKARE